ncbi:MAG: hypothetical protein ABW321_27395, partial [Polyangiales bacterium]
GASLGTQVSPLFEQLAARSGEVIAAQASAFADAQRELTRELEREAMARREQTAESLKALHTRFDDAERERVAAQAKQLEALVEVAKRSVGGGDEREQLVASRWDDLLKRLDAQLEAARVSEQERLRSLDAQLAAARRTEHERLRSLETQIDTAQERAGEQLGKIDELATKVGGELERLSGALSAQLQQRLASERAHDTLTERSLLQLEAAGTALEQGAARQQSALTALVERLPPLFSEAAQSSQQAAERALAQLVETTEHNLARVSGLLSDELSQRSASARTLDQRALGAYERIEQGAAVLETAIARQGSGLEALIAQVKALLPELTEAAQAGAGATLARLSEGAEQQTLRLRESTAELSGLLSDNAARLAQLFEQSAAQQAERARALTEQAFEQARQHAETQAAQLRDSVEQQEQRLRESTAQLMALASTHFEEQAGRLRESAAAHAAQLQTSTAEQVQRLAAIEALIEEGRDEHVRGLASLVTTHADELEQRFAKTSAAVQEASAVWQAASVEMQAVAELFASSVERQRAASDAWIEGLSQVEGAVERSGLHAARDALADQLSSTQEVFARQLQFQRELFEQLRTLRSGGARVVNGEQDVSL